MSNGLAPDDDEMNAGAIATFLDALGIGKGDHALAALMSALRYSGIDPSRGTYEDELALAQRLQQDLEYNDPRASKMARYGGAATGAIPLAYLGLAGASGAIPMTAAEAVGYGVGAPLQFGFGATGGPEPSEFRPGPRRPGRIQYAGFGEDEESERGPGAIERLFGLPHLQPKRSPGYVDEDRARLSKKRKDEMDD